MYIRLMCLSPGRKMIVLNWEWHLTSKLLITNASFDSLDLLPDIDVVRERVEARWCLYRNWSTSRRCRPVIRLFSVRSQSLRTTVRLSYRTTGKSSSCTIFTVLMLVRTALWLTHVKLIGYRFWLVQPLFVRFTSLILRTLLLRF